MNQYLPISIKERVIIKKYAEGVDPKTGEPFEICEPREIIITGQAAIDRLHTLGLTDADIEKLKEASVHAAH